MLAFGAAKAVSLAQTFIIARTFGVGSAWDSFVTANRIPELIFTLIAGGALAYAFIPIFSGFLARGDNDGAWHTAVARHQHDLRRDAGRQHPRLHRRAVVRRQRGRAGLHAGACRRKPSN